jgi:hypothetical protein
MSTCRTLAAPSIIAGGAEDEAITTCGRRVRVRVRVRVS